MMRVLTAYMVENYELELIDLGQEWSRKREVWITRSDVQLRCVRREEAESVGLGGAYTKLMRHQ
jgi:hypothetical protein